MKKTDNKLSLLTPEAEQLPLLTSDQMAPELFKESEAEQEEGKEYKREFTAARLFSENRDSYLTIISLLAEGLGLRRIGRLMKVSPNTVIAVRDREGVNVDTEKERLSHLYRNGARMCGESILEDLADPDRCKKISTKDKAIVLGVLTEKAELLAGLPTARVRVEKDQDIADEWNRTLKTLDADAVEVGPAQSIGLPGEDIQQRESAAPGAARDTVSGATGGEPEAKGGPGESDNESANEVALNHAQKADGGNVDESIETIDDVPMVEDTGAHEGGGGGQDRSPPDRV